MTTNFRSMSVSALLDALAKAGEKPPRELLEACLTRREELTPHLLRIVEAGWWPTLENRKWKPEDDRWLLTVHAARLLIHWREVAALPHFAKILADEDQENLHDWFEDDMALMGPVLIGHLAPLLTQEIWKFCKTGIMRTLRIIAQRFPEARRPVIQAIRSTLPSLAELDASANESVDDDPSVVWAFAALELAELRHKESIPVVKRLHELGYIDETVYGDFDEYLKILLPDSRRRDRRPPSNLFDMYNHLG